MGKRAIVIGATGLVGSSLIDQLIADETFSEIVVLHRRAIAQTHPKIQQHIIDFDQPETWSHFVTGDVLFSSLGTTLKTAGGKANQYKVDFTYQYKTAEMAVKNGVLKYVLVSSSGASEKSALFYSKMKGELDQAVKDLGFSSVTILRPSVLVGDRKEKRAGERMGIKIGNWITKLPFLKPYAPILASNVAKAMINGAKQSNYSYQIFSNDEVLKLAQLNL